jgi:alcohol dehydrogenase
VVSRRYPRDGTGLPHTRRGGSTNTAGLPNPNHLFSFSPVSLVAEARTLRSGYVGSSVPERDIPRCVDLYQRGKLPIDRLMGRLITLDEVIAGFYRLASGHSLRDVVVF